MKKKISRLTALFKPAEFSACELLVMRILFALVVWNVIPERLNLHEQAAPVGMAKWLGMDFTFLSDPEMLSTLRWVLAAVLVVYCSGRLLFAALPYMLFMTVSCGTLINSQKAANRLLPCACWPNAHGTCMQPSRAGMGNCHHHQGASWRDAWPYGIPSK